jgi:hypothetical protein
MMVNGTHNHIGYKSEEPPKPRLREYQPLKMDPQLVDDFLTHEIDKLSFKDRNDIYEEIHGVVSMAREESPELIEQSLVEISREIDRIKHKYRAYVEATKSYNPYLHGMEIRLRFLRCDLFDVPKAAVRMLKYLDLTQELYGNHALTRPILLRDLGKLEMEMLRVGDAQPMPFRDRSGRRLMVAMNNFGLQYPLEVRVRARLCCRSIKWFCLDLWCDFALSLFSPTVFPLCTVFILYFCESHYLLFLDPSCALFVLGPRRRRRIATKRTHRHRLLAIEPGGRVSGQVCRGLLAAGCTETHSSEQPDVRMLTHAYCGAPHVSSRRTNLSHDADGIGPEHGKIRIQIEDSLR